MTNSDQYIIGCIKKQKAFDKGYSSKAFKCHPDPHWAPTLIDFSEVTPDLLMSHDDAIWHWERYEYQRMYKPKLPILDILKFKMIWQADPIKHEYDRARFLRQAIGHKYGYSAEAAYAEWLDQRPVNSTDIPTTMIETRNSLDADFAVRGWWIGRILFLFSYEDSVLARVALGDNFRDEYDLRHL